MEKEALYKKFIAVVLNLVFPIQHMLTSVIAVDLAAGPSPWGGAVYHLSLHRRCLQIEPSWNLIHPWRGVPSLSAIPCSSPESLFHHHLWLQPADRAQHGGLSFIQSK